MTFPKEFYLPVTNAVHILDSYCFAQQIKAPIFATVNTLECKSVINNSQILFDEPLVKSSFVGLETVQSKVLLPLSDINAQKRQELLDVNTSVNQLKSFYSSDKSGMTTSFHSQRPGGFV